MRNSLRSSFAVSFLLFLSLVAWSVSSPIGSGVDADFHLGSIWCARGEVKGLCESIDMAAQPQPTAAEKAKTVPSSKPAPAPATKEELVERLKQEADDKKKMAEHSDPRFSLLAQTVPNWIMGKVSSVGHDSQVKLGEEIILTEFLNNIGNHIKQTKKFNNLL